MHSRMGLTLPCGPLNFLVWVVVIKIRSHTLSNYLFALFSMTAYFERWSVNECKEAQDGDILIMAIETRRTIQHKVFLLEQVIYDVSFEEL